MPDYRSQFKPEVCRTFDSATFTGVYQAIGTPLLFPSRMLIFVNNSGVLVSVSWDGVNLAFPLLPGATVVLDESSNSVAGSTLVSVAGTQFYISGVASTGLVYIASFYAL